MLQVAHKTCLASVRKNQKQLNNSKVRDFPKLTLILLHLHFPTNIKEQTSIKSQLGKNIRLTLDRSYTLQSTWQQPAFLHRSFAMMECSLTQLVRI